ncbi:hypothetical protein GWK47_012776 [Chionoecetes opilio]|uniref:Uncharacterized protein n=1 Tax=Chionoecetes opilio TaxID=41210 RepID=A0A8J4Y127_CHIOP|nr:hypothetical protein GWK47_012776 [Chionoecetes opilio]
MSPMSTHFGNVRGIDAELITTRQPASRPVVLCPCWGTADKLSEILALSENCPRRFGDIRRQFGDNTPNIRRQKRPLHFQISNSATWTPNSLRNVPELSPKCRNSVVYSRRNVAELSRTIPPQRSRGATSHDSPTSPHASGHLQEGPGMGDRNPVASRHRRRRRCELRCLRAQSTMRGAPSR